MQIDEAFKLEQSDKILIEENCHDCGEPVCIEVTKDKKGYLFKALHGGAVYGPTVTGHTCPFFKCKACYEKEPMLRNWNPCEVYTRVVGYYRPVSAFNKGKQKEYQNRKNFQDIS